MALIFILFAWPLLHAPFSFASGRYMLPTRMLFDVLAALGVMEIWNAGRMMPLAGRKAIRYFAVAALTVTVLFYGTASILVVQNAHQTAAESDEGMFALMRPALSQLPADATLVVGSADVVRRANPAIEYVGLLNHVNDYPSLTAGQEALVLQLGAALGEHHPVYYLRTQWEEDIAGWGDLYLGFFEAVEANFALTQIAETPIENTNGFTWKLFQVSERRQALTDHYGD